MQGEKKVSVTFVRLQLITVRFYIIVSGFKGYNIIL